MNSNTELEGKLSQESISSTVNMPPPPPGFDNANSATAFQSKSQLSSSTAPINAKLKSENYQNQHIKPPFLILNMLRNNFNLMRENANKKYYNLREFILEHVFHQNKYVLFIFHSFNFEFEFLTFKRWSSLRQQSKRQHL